MSKRATIVIAMAVSAIATHSQAQAPRTRAEAAAFCYDVIRYTYGGGTDARYRQCMFDLGYPLPKADK